MAQTERQAEMQAKMKNYVSIVPLWIRIGSIVSGLAATIYLVIEDRSPFRALWMLFGSYKLAFLITWLIFLVPAVAVIWTLAVMLHARRKRQDFPSARVVDRNETRPPG